MAKYTDRILRAAKLDKSLYEEVEKDQEAMGQALGVVLLSSIAAGIASIGKGGLGGIVIGTLLALISWYIWIMIIYFVGTRLLPEPGTKADFRDLFRTIGFASAPGILMVIGIIPFFTLPILLAASLWMLACMVVAVRLSLNYTNILRAIGVCAIGWIVYLVIFRIFFSML